MRSVGFTFLAVLLAVAFEIANAQSYNNYYNPNRDGRPVVTISGNSGIRRTYVPPPTEITEADAETYPSSRQDAKKVRLDVYYASDCPDSMRFITRQLYPLYKEMEDALDINLVPYGKAHETYAEDKKRYNFRCQHGPSECYGNTLQTCAMSLYPQKDYMEFINCMERYSRPSLNGRKCARRLSLDWGKIDKCTQGEEGNRLMHEMAQQTESLDPRLHFVPWIVVDKVYSQSNQRNSLRNLKGVVCDAYKGNHPHCRQLL